MAARHLGRRHGRSGRHGCRGGGGARIKDRTVAVRWRRRRTRSLQLVDVERQAKEPSRERKPRPGDGTKQIPGGGDLAGRPRPGGAPSKYQALGFQRPTCAIVFCNPPPSLADKLGWANNLDEQKPQSSASLQLKSRPQSSARCLAVPAAKPASCPSQRA